MFNAFNYTFLHFIFSYYFYSLIKIKQMLAVDLVFVCVNLRDLRETFGFLLGI